MSKLKSLGVLTSLAITLLITGCATQHIAERVPMPEGLITSGQLPEKEVTIKNVHIIEVEERINHTFPEVYAPLVKWTDMIVELAKEELTKRGMKITPDARRKLKFSIDEVKLDDSDTEKHCTLFLKVKLGTKNIHIFEGTHSAKEKSMKVCGIALTRSVAAMLSDNKILKYLRE